VITVDINGPLLDPRDIQCRVDVFQRLVSAEDAHEISLSLLSGNPDDAEVTSAVAEELLFLQHFIEELGRDTFDAAVEQGAYFIAKDAFEDWARDYLSDTEGLDYESLLWDYVDMERLCSDLQQDMQLVTTSDREWFLTTH